MLPDRLPRIPWSVVADNAQKVILSPQDIHLWFVDLDRAPEYEKLTTVLSVEERSRAERFYTEQLRHRFAAGRAMLRGILNHYLAWDANRIEFHYNDKGKPHIDFSRYPTDRGDTYTDSYFYGSSATEADNSSVRLPEIAIPLHFNLSHSHHMALYAISRSPIGVDLEHIRPLPNALDLAQRFFAPSEFQILQTLPVEQQAYTFFRYWVCKEAYVKAIGEGLAHLDRVEVALGDRLRGRSPTLVQVDHLGDATTQRWFLTEVTVSPEAVAAVASQAESAQFKYGYGTWDFL